jgi:phosphatidylglycerophosphate synthase
VLAEESSIIIGGMTLSERAVLLAHRAGLSPVIQQPANSLFFEGAHKSEGAVVVGPNVLFAPAVLADLVDWAERGGPTAAAAVFEEGTPILLYVPGRAIADVRACLSLEMAAGVLADVGTLRALPLEGRFCRHVTGGDSARSVEREYIRHLNGGAAESYFTKKIRRFSVPLTGVLVRRGAKPTQVTAGGLVLAMASAWCLAQGTYGAGLAGAVLYYASMIFDCSDGEVARLSVQDSPFGAWLETMVDYLTYFLILGALTIASQDLPGAETHRAAAAVALVGSLLVAAVAGYLRHRVAAADPGQFDDASANALASAPRFHRFARWGRQWIKRSTLAHLVVALALVNQLPVLLYLWAFGATLASFVILIVEPFVVRRVSVARTGVRSADAGGWRGADRGN